MSAGDIDADFSYLDDEAENQNGNSLTASGIAEYIRFNCCPRFFKLKFEGKELKKRKWPEAFKPISPLLYGAGKLFEAKKISELQEKATDYHDFATKYDPYQHGWDRAVDSLNELRKIIETQLLTDEKTSTRTILLYQVPMKGSIGVWNITGIADLIAIWPIKNGKVTVRIFELKASWKEQTTHRIQVAIYAILLSQVLADLISKVEIEGGVINRETSLENLNPESLPKFKLSPLLQDVERLLAENGELNRIHQTPLEHVEFQLCLSCDNCGFNECCIICAVETENIALLNLSRGEQKTLRYYGISKLEDLARLKPVFDTYSLRPYDFKNLPANDPQKVYELSADPIVGPKLDWLIERAQYMLSGIRPGSCYASKSRWMPWLTSTGYGGLPEDSPPMGVDTSLMFSPDSMIRIYLFVEWDYMLDIVSLISARVNCTRYRGEPPSVSQVVRALPDDHQACLDQEKDLLEAFFKDLTIAIQKVANEAGNSSKAPMHLYFFSRQERDILMKAVCRHPSLISANAIRDLLGLRQAIDQPMFSILQDEVRHRKALKFHSYGLLPILEQIAFFDRKNWTTKRKDNTTVDLSLVFRDGLFNYALPFNRNPDGSIVFLRDEIVQKDGYYPARARFSNQLPVEYIWGAKGKLENYHEKGKAKILLEKRKWCDYTQKTRRITDEELNLMGQKICLALEHIERSLTIRNRRLKKAPIDVPTIAEFSLGPSTLERSCREFLDLEYFSKRQEMYQHYALLPYQRVASGRSLIFQCTNVFESEQEFTVCGKLIYEGIGMPKTDCVANACRVKGSDDSSSGDWMVVTELTKNSAGQFEEAQKRSPSEVEKSARAIVNKVDIQKFEITLKVVSWPRGKGSKYSAWHNLPTTNPEKAKAKYMQLFEKGRYYILDELADDIISDRAAKCLDYSNNNMLYLLLTDYLAGKTTNSTHTALPMTGATHFLNWMTNRRLPPKAEQARFVDHVFGKEPIVMLQGPPGTGKTETLQLAVLSHVAAHHAISKCRVLMVAPTHKAIQEFVTKLARCWQEYISTDGKDLKNLQIFRVLSSNTASAEPIDGVTYINYNEDKDTIEELTGILMNQTTLTPKPSAADPLILCLTPPSLYGLMKKIGGNEPPWGEGFFDLLVVDEASMMRLPELILSGSFLTKSSQILIAGDHRQLSPIVSHNWEKEDRRTLEEMASFLSAMDFLRLLRNEDLGIERIKCPNPVDIPAERLCESHRCHSVVAAFLKEWVYEKDQIDFRSDQRETLTLSKPKTDGLDVVFEPENVFVLIVHDETESFQSNFTEALIANTLVRCVSPKTVGIITPHNAQKGLLKNMLAEGYSETRVDTVERYQGGEADFIIISSTVSDSDYIRGESDFLLNLNRINVSISRMKKKLVIIASRSIFEFMPQDAKDYDKALLWRGISQTVGYTANSKPCWTGDLSKFINQAVPSQVKIEIYVKSEK
ncbi:MAG: AAA domain-containing protein [Candidatus Bathyarchaeota archaeon]|nr:AAA domain-containing protein [Candidatus Termiticorpusculum sp.]